MFMSRRNKVISYFLLHKFMFWLGLIPQKRHYSKIPIYEVKN
jgi:hypothetical protein